jgi:hypothetical protein
VVHFDNYTPWEYILTAQMTRRPAHASPESFLPLSAVVFEILLALAGSDLHGYDIMREVDQRSGGRATLHPGTLYRALHRLLNDRLVEELDDRPDPALDDC